MARTPEALVKPELLRWARESAGFDVEAAARKIGVRPERLASWEAGELRPSIAQLRNLAWAFRRPIAVFYLPEAPQDVHLPRDFRRLPGEVSGVESPELRYELRRAAARRDTALELLHEEGEEPGAVSLTASLGDEPEEVGGRVRAALGVRVEDQLRWRDPYDSFNGWRAAIEAAGALVLQMTDVALSEARGFAISEQPLPVIVANIKDSPRGRTFTLVHEFAHLLLRESGLCDLDDVTRRAPEALRVERFCNKVAGATLVPAAVLLRDGVVLQHGDDPAWTDRDLSSLGQRYGVSREVILRRLLDLGRTDEHFYSEKREEFLSEYEEARQRRSAGFAPPHQVALASAGPAFTGLVLTSYAHGNITASDVSDYLGIRLKHLPRIEEQLLSRSRMPS